MHITDIKLSTFIQITNTSDSIQLQYTHSVLRTQKIQNCMHTTIFIYHQINQLSSALHSYNIYKIVCKLLSKQIYDSHQTNIFHSIYRKQYWLQNTHTTSIKLIVFIRFTLYTIKKCNKNLALFTKPRKACQWSK